MISSIVILNNCTDIHVCGKGALRRRSIPSWMIWSRLTVTLVCCVLSIGALVPDSKQQENRPDDSKGIWFMKPWYPSPRIIFLYIIFLLLLDGGQFHCPSNRPSIWKSAECIYISDWPVAYHFHRICRRLGPFWCKIVWRRMVFVRTKAQNLSSV